MNINLARAVGPAIAGLLIARVGVVGVFALNTVTFVFYAAVMLAWRPQLPARHGRPEPFLSAVLAGGRYVRYSAQVRRIFLSTALFAVPYSALTALLPVAANHRLGLSAGGYGLLLAALGTGAITGGLLLPRVNARLSINQLVVIASLVLAAAMVAVVAIPSMWPALVVLVPAGAASIAVFANITASLQLFLPAWVRGRALSVFQMVLFGSLGAGSLAFGLLGEHAGVLASLLVAAVLMALGAGSIGRWPFPDVAAADRTPWTRPEPRLVPELEPRDEAVMVTVRYTVAPEGERAFIAGMEEMRRARLSTGAVQWGLFRDAEAPQQFTEFKVFDLTLPETRWRRATARRTSAARSRRGSARNPRPDGCTEASQERPLPIASYEGVEKGQMNGRTCGHKQSSLADSFGAAPGGEVPATSVSARRRGRRRLFAVAEKRHRREHRCRLVSERISPARDWIAPDERAGTTAAAASGASNERE